jgi:hypothetical protein
MLNLNHKTQNELPTQTISDTNNIDTNNIRHKQYQTQIVCVDIVCLILFVSFNSNMTGAISGAGTASLPQNMSSPSFF